MTSRRPAIPPWLAIIFGILAVSTASIFIRYAQQYASSLVIAAWRLTLATLILLPAALIRERRALQSLPRREFSLAFLSGLVLALHFAAWITSLEYTTVASSVVFVSTSPLFVALLSPFLLKEKLSNLVIVGLILTLLGGTIVGLSDTCTRQGLQMTCPPLADFFAGRAFLGDLLALFGALAAALYMLIGRRLRAVMSLGSYIFLVYGIAAVILILIMFSFGKLPWGYPAQAYLWFLLLALVPQILGHSTFNWALGYLSAVFVSITLLGEPIGSSILAYFLLHETPSDLKIFGAILILLGIFIASLGEYPPKAKPPTDAVGEHNE